MKHFTRTIGATPDTATTTNHYISYCFFSIFKNETIVDMITSYKKESIISPVRSAISLSQMTAKSFCGLVGIQILILENNVKCKESVR